MITVSQIRNGAGYLSRHLSANDYYSEGERVEGYWLGKGAEKLGLKGAVKEAEFEALRTNRHPYTREKLTPRVHKVAFHDIVVSAPKSFSIAAIVGQDERLVAAFHESSRWVLGELEKHAAVRVRAGGMVNTEVVKITGNVACAAFHHDSSRMLGPQLHTHLVIANVSFDEQQQRWMALQPKGMLESSKQSIRTQFHDDLAQRARNLGYEVFRENGEFRIEGISCELEERFSQRSRQRREFEERYRKLFQHEPSKERIEAFIKEGRSAARTRFSGEFETHFQRRPSADEVDKFVKDWRSAHLKKTSTAEVRKNQLSQLSGQERTELEALVAKARKLTVATKAHTHVEAERERTTFGDDAVPKARVDRPVSTPAMGQRKSPKAAVATPKKQKVSDRADELRRQKLLRDMRRGLAVTRAMQGNPAAAIARNLRNASRR